MMQSIIRWFQKKQASAHGTDRLLKTSVDRLRNVERIVEGGKFATPDQPRVWREPPFVDDYFVPIPTRRKRRKTQ